MSDPVRLRRLIEERLQDTRPAVDPRMAYPAGVTPEANQAIRQFFPAAPIAAAVLVPIVEHPHGLSVLLTERAAHLKHHPGQISFPGGRIEPSDAGPLDAALRETEEEIGLGRSHIELLGALPDYLTGTGFRVTPVVGLVHPPFRLRLDAFEVAEAFEVPLSHFLDPANHQRHSMMHEGRLRHFHAMPYGDYYIWGATAGMIMSLYKVLRQG